MLQPATHSQLSVAEYLTREEGAECRHEYVNGQLYAMTGASRAHNLICMNIGAALRPRLRGTPCQLFANDMKLYLQINKQDIFYYPDLLLTCDPNDRQTYYCTAPGLLIEVLSDSTERIDRREKLWAYQTLPSLTAYWLVAQHQPRLEIYRRSNQWQMESITSGEVRVEALDLAVSLDTIYEDVLIPGL